MNSGEMSNSIRVFYVFATLLVLLILFGIFDLARQFREQVTLTSKRHGSLERTPKGISNELGSIDLQRGENLYLQCSSCHGDKAQGNKNLNAPALNVQEDWYIVRQLKKFKEGIRGTDPNDIPGMQMRPVALTLKDEEAMKSLAAYIKTFKIEGLEPPQQTNQGDVTRGKEYYTACVACHGDQGQGIKTLHAPALSGQHDWYIIMQLKNFKEGIRGAVPGDTTGALMRPMAMTLPNEQAMADVAAYISTFPVFPQESPPGEGRDELARLSKATHENPEIGRKIFEVDCASCHLQNGEGRIGLAPSIRNRDFLAIASDEFIKSTIILGRPGTSMLPRPDLSEDEIDHIIAFLRSLPVPNPVEISVDPNKTFAGDPTAGGTKYALYCASCHGPNGEGYSAGGSGPGIGLSSFLLLVSDDYIFQTVKYGRTGTPMRPFIGPKGIANLTESDVHDIIAHLRTLSGGISLIADEGEAEPVSSVKDPHQGRKIFETNCAVCHQKNGEGKIGLAPSIRNRDFLAIASDEFIKTTIKEGRLGTSMVPRPDLSDNDINHLIAFLKSLPITNPVEVSIDPHKKITGNDRAGKIKFSQFCASCHGSKGEGYGAGGSGPGIGLSGFLNAASDDYIFQTVKYGRIGTPMKSFMGPEGLANLEEIDVNDIIAYLRSL